MSRTWLPLVEAVQRRLAAFRGLQAACAVLAAAGWVPAVGLVVEHTAGVPGVPSAWIVLGALVAVAALVVGLIVAARTPALAAARHLDTLIGGDQWTLVTARELQSAAGDNDGGNALVAAVHQRADEIVREAKTDAPLLPPWRHPIAALLAALWVALVGWLWLVEPLPGAGTMPAIAPGALRADDLVAVQRDAAARGDQRTADALDAMRQAMQAGDMRAMADALHSYESALADRLRQHQRQSQFLKELDEATRRANDPDKPISDADWKALLAKLADAARHAGDTAAVAQLERARESTLTKEQRRELLAAMQQSRDATAAADRREIDQLQMMLDAARRGQPHVAPRPMADAPPANANASTGTTGTDGNSSSGSGSHPPGTAASPTANQPPEANHHNMVIPLQARPRAANDPVDQADQLPPGLRSLATRYTDYARRQGDNR
ncbi:MAG: hypothetical protein AB7K09_04240 [Planctomycetota bacterium]